MPARVSSKRCGPAVHRRQGPHNRYPMSPDHSDARSAPGRRRRRIARGHARRAGCRPTGAVACLAGSTALPRRKRRRQRRWTSHGRRIVSLVGPSRRCFSIRQRHVRHPRRKPSPPLAGAFPPASGAVGWRLRASATTAALRRLPDSAGGVSVWPKLGTDSPLLGRRRRDAARRRLQFSARPCPPADG